MRDLIVLGLSALALGGCGTCLGASCPDAEPTQIGTYEGYFTDGELADAEATVEYTGDEVIITVADEDGNVWEYRYEALSWSEK